MFKKSDNYKESAQLIIGLALVEFHKGIDKQSLIEENDIGLVTDIIKVVDFQTEFFKRVFKAGSYLRIPLILLEADSVFQAADLESVHLYATGLLLEELNILLDGRDHIQLIEFIQPSLFNKNKSQEKFVSLLSHI